MNCCGFLHLLFLGYYPMPYSVITKINSFIGNICIIHKIKPRFLYYNHQIKTSVCKYHGCLSHNSYVVQNL